MHCSTLREGIGYSEITLGVYHPLATFQNGHYTLACFCSFCNPVFYYSFFCRVADAEQRKQYMATHLACLSLAAPLLSERPLETVISSLVRFS